MKVYNKLLEGSINYPGKGTITDEYVWRCVVKHSTVFDRMNKKKLVEMAITSLYVLMGIYEHLGWFADKNWMYYGKGGFFESNIGNI